MGVPIGTDEYVLEWALEVVRGGGADSLARCLASMPDKQAAASCGVLTMESLGQSLSHLERALATGLSLEACRRASNGAPWACGKKLGLPGVAEAQSYFQEGCPGNQLTWSPRQQAQARLSARVGGLGLPSTEARQCLPPVGTQWGPYGTL